MNRYWICRSFTYRRAFKAYFCGMGQFRTVLVPRFWDPRLQSAYDLGRATAHKLTFHHFHQAFQ